MMGTAIGLAVATCGGAVMVDGLATLCAAAAVLGCAASHTRQAFDSIVQSTSTVSNRARAFATFETRAQVGWVIGSASATALYLPLRASAAVICVLLVASLALFRRGTRRTEGRTTATA